jgi:radical SAM superfamily enzyme YgiQ (UPF0313 family)
MARPKLQIIVLFQNLGDEHPYFARNPAPPLSGVLLAALTPPVVEVEVLHEMVRPIDYGCDADFIALSFMDYCAPHAIEVARRFRRLGKKVVAGGRYASTFPEALAGHFDSVVVGEAEGVWPRVVRDLVANRLEPRYDAPFAMALDDIPPPRYDLVEPSFAIAVVTEATRGCPFRCTYCQLNIRPAPFRKRPVADVIRDLTATAGVPFHKRKMAMIYDNNFGGDMRHAKELLRAISRLDLWGVGLQFTLGCLDDPEFVDLLVDARCTMAFVGVESLNEASLVSVKKHHNLVRKYREQFGMLKERGILTFAGFMVALDEDTPEYYREAPAKLEAVDPSAILTSIAIPIPGTPLHQEAVAAGRIVDDDLRHYEGDHLVFQPRGVSATDVFDAYERIPAAFYAWPAVIRRWWRLMKAYWTSPHGRHRLLRTPLLTAILWQLSRFQRVHARRKVAPVLAQERAKWRRLEAPARPVDTLAGAV